MDKMKRVFSLVLVLAMLVGSFSSFSTIAFAEEAKKEEVKVEEKKEETKEEVKEEAKKEEVKVDDTKVLSNVPKDVIGTDYEEAVTRLVAFGVIGGYPDGTYKPEEEINRAQFAKIMVMALGLNDAVPAAQNQATGFKDVQAGYWAAGYINVASGQGLLKGYPDGTFRPANKVSYAESLTMLVRSLGYQDEFLPGNWPGNYVAKAADVKITSGVTMPADAKTGAKRGPVAQLVDNTLDAKVVKVDKYKPNTKEVEYYETKVTLLKEKLEISKHENTRVYADKIVNDGLSKDEISVRFLADTREAAEVRKTYKENDREDFKSDINIRPFIGEEVTTYLTEKDRVIFMESEKEDKANYEYVKEAVSGEKLDLVAFDKEYAFDKKADVYVFNSSDNDFKYYVGEDLKADTIKDMVKSNGKVVVKNNKIVYAEFQKSSEIAPFMVAMEVDGDVVKGIKQTSDEHKLDLGKDKTYDSSLVFDTNGNKMDIKDIKKGNVLYINKLDYDGDDVALVTVVRDNEVKGAVGSFKDDRISLGGKDYKSVQSKVDGKEAYETYYTVTDLDDIKLWEPTEDEFDKDFDDAYKEEATAYLTATGRIAFLTTVSGDSAGYKYGVVTRTYSDGDRVRIFASIDGKEAKDQIFKADKDSNISKPRYITYKDGKFETEAAGKTQDRDVLGQAVKFKLDKDGEISKDEFYVMDKDSVFVMEKGKDFGKDSIRLAAAKGNTTDVDKKEENTNDKRSFAVSNSLSIVSAEGLNTLTDEFNGKVNRSIEDAQTKPGKVDIDDFDIAKWEDLKEDKYDSELRMYVFPKGNKDKIDADALVFVGKKGANTGSDEVAVYVTETRRADGDNKVTFDEYGKGKQNEVVVDGDTHKAKRAYIAKHKSNGKIELFDEAKELKADDFVAYRNVKVTDVTGSKVTVAKTNKTTGMEQSTRVLDMKSSAVIGDGDKTGKSVEKGQIVDLIIEGNINIRVVGITDVKADVDGSGNGNVELGKEDYIYKAKYTVKGNDYVTLEKDGKTSDVLLAEGVTVEELPSTETVEGKIVTVTIKEIDNQKVIVKMVYSAKNKEQSIKDAQKRVDVAKEADKKADERVAAADKAQVAADAKVTAADAKVTAADAKVTAATTNVATAQSELDALVDPSSEVLNAAKKKLADAKLEEEKAIKELADAKDEAKIAKAELVDVKAEKKSADENKVKTAKELKDAEKALADLK